MSCGQSSAPPGIKVGVGEGGGGGRRRFYVLGVSGRGGGRGALGAGDSRGGAMGEAEAAGGGMMTRLAILAGVGIAVGGVVYYMSTMPASQGAAGETKAVRAAEQPSKSSASGAAAAAGGSAATAGANEPGRGGKQTPKIGAQGSPVSTAGQAGGELSHTGPALMGKWDCPGSIWDAAREGRVQAVEAMVEESLKVADMQDAFGMRPVHWAACGGKHGKAINGSKADPVGVLRYLKRKGANMKALDLNGESAVHHAARWGQTDCIEFLVNECGLDARAKAKDGNTPLDCALRGIAFRAEYVDASSVAKALGEKLPGATAETNPKVGMISAPEGSKIASSSGSNGPASLAGPPLPSPPPKGGKKKKGKKGKH